MEYGCWLMDQWLIEAALVYGQMNEPPGARARVALTGLTVAEYFRDEEGQARRLGPGEAENCTGAASPNSGWSIDILYSLANVYICLHNELKNHHV